MTSWMVLPPRKNKCQCCAVEHPPTEPHDAQSLYYHFWFESQYGRVPTWADAMSHCSEDVQERWMQQFSQCGIDIYSTNLVGDIKTQEDLDQKLRRQKV